MKKLLVLSTLLVFAISLSYAGNNANAKTTTLMKRLVMNQRLITGLSHSNYSVVTHKMHARGYVVEHAFLNNLRLNQRLLTDFLNTTLYGTLDYDTGYTGDYGETQSFDFDLDVDNDGMIHETDSLYIPTGVYPSGFSLRNSQIHVYLSYGPPSYGGTTNTNPYVEHWYPGWYGYTTLSYDYPAADLYEKEVDFDWGDGHLVGDTPPATYQPARSVYIYYNL